MPASNPACLLIATVRDPARIGHLLRRLRLASGRYRQRRALADLDDRLLADIGLTRAEAECECRKQPWR